MRNYTGTSPVCLVTSKQLHQRNQLSQFATGRAKWCGLQQAVNLFKLSASGYLCSIINGTALQPAGGGRNYPFKLQHDSAVFSCKRKYNISNPQLPYYRYPNKQQWKGSECFPHLSRSLIPGLGNKSNWKEKPVLDELYCKSFLTCLFFLLV